MFSEELKRIMEQDPATARGRNVGRNRGINLMPEKHEVDYATKARADMYIDTARLIAERVRTNRYGISDDELERVELVREELYAIARDILTDMVKNG